MEDCTPSPALSEISTCLQCSSLLQEDVLPHETWCRIKYFTNLVKMYIPLFFFLRLTCVCIIVLSWRHSKGKPKLIVLQDILYDLSFRIVLFMSSSVNTQTAGFLIFNQFPPSPHLTTGVVFTHYGFS